MNIQKIAIDSSQKQQNNEQLQVSTSPSFKAGGALSGVLNLFGNTMQSIENGGFLASFLIQDALGMTAPRVGAAFLRDKEVTGVYNVQEGFEVLGREGLTGPCMMAVAPLMFFLAAKTGRSTSVNSQLIKRFGNSFKNLIKDSGFDRTLLNDKDKFKQKYFEKNIREILENTVGKENVKDDSVKFILDQIAKYEKIPADAKLKKNLFGIKSKGKYKNERIEEIVKHINDLKYSTSNDLQMLDKVKVGSSVLNDIKTYSTKDAIEAMMKYSDDAITFNKHLNELDGAAADIIKNKAIGKRFLANVSTIAATLGILSVLPKIYIRSDIAPGARTAMEMQQKKSDENIDKTENNNPTFKGKGPKKSWLVKLGEFWSKLTNKDFVANELEYNGHNFTNTLMTVLSLFGLLLPRGLKANKRAQVDENGKKDKTEIYEILIRDLTSSLAVVFAVPMLTRAVVSSYENKSGFVLMNRDRSKTGWKKTLDLLNPYSNVHVLKNSELTSLYGNVDSHQKLMNFCDYIDRNGGDLQKIFSKSASAEEIFNKNTIKLSDISSLSKKDKNAKIKDVLKNMNKDDNSLNDSIKKLFQSDSKKIKSNKILSFARGLNSTPGVIATVFIVPYILGWLIPTLTYANTRRIHEKQNKEKQSKINVST